MNWVPRIGISRVRYETVTGFGLCIAMVVREMRIKCTWVKLIYCTGLKMTSHNYQGYLNIRNRKALIVLWCQFYQGKMNVNSNINTMAIFYIFSHVKIGKCNFSKYLVNKALWIKYCVFYDRWKWMYSQRIYPITYKTSLIWTHFGETYTWIQSWCIWYWAPLIGMGRWLVYSSICWRTHEGCNQ